MNPSRAICLMAAGAVMAIGAAAPLRAQSPARTSLVIASVTDASSGAPLENAEVTLSDAKLTARTDWSGEARIPNVSPGPHKFEIRHPGYSALAVDLMVQGDSTGPVFRLVSTSPPPQPKPAAPSTPALDPVSIPGRAPSALAEFETRRAQGKGKYLIAEELAANANRSLTMVVVRAFGGLMSAPDPSRPGRDVLMTRRTNARLAHSDTHCGVDIYLDGSRFLEDLDSLHPSDLGGIEYYSIETAPGSYRGLTDNCGVLLLWT